MKKAIIFPGQGSQAKGMGGKDLFSNYPKLVEKSDEMLGYSLEDLCLNDPQNLLNQTQFTQPAIFAVSALMYLKEIEETGVKPDYVAGHSLGEYSALFAANAISFTDGLRLVIERGRIMSQIKGGSMAAIIGLNEKQITTVLTQYNLNQIDIANYNSPTQIVISGPEEVIKNSDKYFTDAGAQMYIPLKVSGAFHSRFMENTIEEFSSVLNKVNFQTPEISVISNVEARPYQGSNIKQLLEMQITNSVRWTESVIYMLNNGVSDFKELGNGKVLTGLISKIKIGLPVS